MVLYYKDNRSNSRANTCTKTRLLEGSHLLDFKPFLFEDSVNHSNLADLSLTTRRFIQISALSAFDGSVLDYHGFNG